MDNNTIINIEEMTNKVIEYIHTTTENDSDYEFQCMSGAAKFLLASFSFDKPLMLSNKQILDKCADLGYMIINIAQK